ncbi:hypothetical protein AAC387_Pa01g4299 [Persea americana]
MAKLSSTVLFLVLLVSFTYLQATVSASAFCDGKCEARCSQAGLKDRCLKYCGICCKECNCVPSGTYGNKHECPCYRDKLNKKLKPKCP